jgi:hypothetical protein
MPSQSLQGRIHGVLYRKAAQQNLNSSPPTPKFTLAET